MDDSACTASSKNVGPFGWNIAPHSPATGTWSPANRLNPVALALLRDIPRANVPGTINGGQDFFYSPNLGLYRYNTYLTRIDHNFSDAHRLSFSNSANWGYERRDENGLPPPAIQSGSWPMHRNHLLDFDSVPGDPAHFTDRQTRSVWNLAGKAVDGMLNGEGLSLAEARETDAAGLANLYMEAVAQPV